CVCGIQQQIARLWAETFIQRLRPHQHVGVEKQVHDPQSLSKSESIRTGSGTCGSNASRWPPRTRCRTGAMPMTRARGLPRRVTTHSSPDVEASFNTRMHLALNSEMAISMEKNRPVN